jgi:hypothetical protein
MPSEKDVWFSQHALRSNNGKFKLDVIPDQKILNYVLIHCDKYDFSLYGLTFHDEKHRCLLRVGDTPDPKRAKDNSCFSVKVEIGTNEKILGFVSRLDYNKRPEGGKSAECFAFQLVIGKLSS